MHCLMFIKCRSINEDYQIRNTQHSEVLNRLRVANQKCTNYMCKTENKQTQNTQEKRKHKTERN